MPMRIAAGDVPHFILANPAVGQAVACLGEKAAAPMLQVSCSACS